MGIIILLVVIFVAVNIVRAIFNEKKRGTMDESGNVRCSRCGCTTFAYEKGKYGETVTKCVNCGRSWKTV